MISASCKRLRREEACVYLRENHGIRRTPATLAKYATLGGGPSFRKDGRFPIYDVSELDRWAASIISEPRASTSDGGEAAP